MSSYQSYLWNNSLSYLMNEIYPKESLEISSIIRPLNFPTIKNESGFTDSFKIPYLTSRINFPPLDQLNENYYNEFVMNKIYQKIREEEGLISFKKLKVKGFERKVFFSKGEREIFFRPIKFNYLFEEDQINRGKLNLKLNFQIHRSSYASLIVKHLSILSKIPII